MANKTSFQGVRYSFENSDPVRRSMSTRERWQVEDEIWAHKA